MDEAEDDILSLRDHKGFQRLLTDAKDRCFPLWAKLRKSEDAERTNGGLDELEWLAGYVDWKLAKIRARKTNK